MTNGFIQARHCGPKREGLPIDLVVIHTMEHPEKPGTARAVAEWFGSSTAPQASAHYCIDADEIIQCVALDVIAWGAPGANRHGIQVEHAGFASQTPAEWSDRYSDAVLRRSAALVAMLCIDYAIPVVHVDGEGLADPNARGITGHADVTAGRCEGRGHTDPGPAFPWDEYLALVLVEQMRRRATLPPPAPGDDHGSA